MTTRKYRTVLLIAAAAGFSLAATNDSIKGIDLLPRQERLQPMILTKGVWQVSNGVDLLVRKSPEGVWGPELSYACFNFMPRRALSRRIELPKFPWLPYVKILMTESDIGLRPDGTMNRFAAAFDGGLTGISYSGANSFMFNMRSSVATKYLLNERWWHEQALVVMMTSIDSWNFNSCTLLEKLGYQITDNIACTMGIDGGCTFSYWNWFKQTIFGAAEAHLIARFTKRFGLDVGGTIRGWKVLDGTKPVFAGAISPSVVFRW